MASREHEARAKLLNATTGFANVIEKCTPAGDELVFSDGSAVTVKADRLWLDVVDNWRDDA